MWKRRNWIVIGLTVICLTLGGLYEYATHVGRGWLRGEAFYDSRPTSWWRCELEQWEVCSDVLHIPDERGRRFPLRREWYVRNPTGFEEFCKRWIAIVPAGEQQMWPRLLDGEEAAIPVLQELCDDSSPKIRQFAQIGLGMNLKPSEDHDE